MLRLIGRWLLEAERSDTRYKHTAHRTISFNTTTVPATVLGCFAASPASTFSYTRVAVKSDKVDRGHAPPRQHPHYPPQHIGVLVQ